MSAQKINLFCKHSQNQCIPHSLQDFVQWIEVDFSNWVINKLWNMYHEKSNMEHKSQSMKTQISVEWYFLGNLKMENVGCFLQWTKWLMTAAANPKLVIIQATRDGAGVSAAERDGVAMMLVPSGDCVSDPSPPELNGESVIANNNSSSWI